MVSAAAFIIVCLIAGSFIFICLAPLLALLAVVLAAVGTGLALLIGNIKTLLKI